MTLSFKCLRKSVDCLGRKTFIGRSASVLGIALSIMVSACLAILSMVSVSPDSLEVGWWCFSCLGQMGKIAQCGQGSDHHSVKCLVLLEIIRN